MDKEFLYPIKPEDLFITTYRGHLPANSTQYMLRITHEPTGLNAEGEVGAKEHHYMVQHQLIAELKTKLRNRGWILIAEWGALLVFLLFLLTLGGLILWN